MAKVIKVIDFIADRADMFEHNVNAALEDGWEILNIALAPTQVPKLVAVMFRNEDEERVPGKPAAPKGKAAKVADTAPTELA